MPEMPREDLERDLRDPEFAKLYGAAAAKTEFAVVFARARRSLGITQDGIADKLGLSQPYIAKLEGGDANPTIGAIGSLLAVLGLRLAMNTEPLLSYPTPPFWNIGEEEAREFSIVFEGGTPVPTKNIPTSASTYRSG